MCTLLEKLALMVFTYWDLGGCWKATEGLSEVKLVSQAFFSLDNPASGWLKLGRLLCRYPINYSHCSPYLKAPRAGTSTMACNDRPILPGLGGPTPWPGDDNQKRVAFWTREAGMLPNFPISSPTSPDAQQSSPEPRHPVELCNQDMSANSLLSHPIFQRPNLFPENISIYPPPFWILFENCTLGPCIASKRK